MKTYTETECIEAIERNWGEIESYEWRGDHEQPECRCVVVIFTAAAADKIAARCNSSVGARLFKKPLTARDVAQRDFCAKDIARELGHAAYNCPSGDCPECAEFCEGGIAVFSDYTERNTWINQK